MNWWVWRRERKEGERAARMREGKGAVAPVVRKASFLMGGGEVEGMVSEFGVVGGWNGSG